MAGGMDLGTPNGGGGKKPLDMTVNLVPFIDLMAVTIAFLIMTAVWTQVGRLQVTSAGTSSAEQQKDPEPSVPVALLLTTREFRLSVGGIETDVLPQVRDAKGRLTLAALRQKLGAVRAQESGTQSITLNTEDDVRYDDLVGVIDTCIAAGLPGVKVAPAAG